MPSAGVFAVAAVATLLFVGASKAVHGVKKAAHAIGCVVRHGHNCAKK